MLRGPGLLSRLLPTVQSAQSLPSFQLNTFISPICIRHASTAGPALTSALKRHDDKVRIVSAKVADYHARGQKFRIFHGSTNSTRPRDHSHRSNTVDTSQLNEVIYVHIQHGEQHCLVEPNVPMDRLVEATLDHDLVPKVVMEFPGITAGGGYNGTSGESSSFKYGFFDRTIDEVEMVLADGQITTCSPDHQSDLFDGAAGALGTLGITTLIKLQLVPAKRYVEVEYIPVTSIEQTMLEISKATTNSTLDYIDGILFSHSAGAVITGRMTDDPSSAELSVQTFSKPADPWFYLHVQDVLSMNNFQGSHRELVPLPDYLFRYDRGGFWVGASAFTHLSFPFTPRTRAFLDDFLHTRMLYTTLHASRQSTSYMVQDLAMPYSSVPEFVNYCNGATARHHAALDIWPLWLCPLKPSPSPTMHPHHPDDSDEPLMNVGLWGFGPAEFESFVVANKALERKLRDLGGMKWLYAHTYYSEADFWMQFDKPAYEALRKKYSAEGLPDIYEKVRIDVDRQRAEQRTWRSRLLNFWILGAIYGIWKAIESKTYLEARNARWMSWPGPKAN